MKKTLTILTVLLITSVFAKAQTMQQEIDYYQSLFGMEKKGVVASFLELEENDPFWKLYDEYDETRQKLGQAKLKTLIEYAENYENLSDDRTDKLVKESIQSRKEMNDLIVKYYKKARKLSGAKTAAQFYQIENYFINAVNGQLYITLPLIGELE